MLLPKPLRLAGAVLIAGTMAVGHVAGAEEARLVGYVESFEGQADDYGIKPAADRETILIYTPIYAGDCIVFNNGSGRIVIRKVNGKTLDLTTPDLACPISDEEAGATPVGNIVKSLGQALTWMLGHEPTMVSARVRGGSEVAPALPLLVHRKPHLAAGARDFTLAWTAGEGPFLVRLTGTADGVLILEETGLTERVLTPRRVDLPKGDFQIEIVDTTGASVTRTIVAVDPSALPSPPADLGLDAMPNEMRATVYAAWLAGQQNGRWSLEAYLHAAPHAEAHEPARILSLGLVVGEFRGL